MLIFFFLFKIFIFHFITFEEKYPNFLNLNKSDLAAKIRGCFRVRNQHIRELFAEFFGTFLLVVFGCGSVAQMILSKSPVNGFLSVNLSFGFGATIAGCVVGKVSGNNIDKKNFFF